jgi:hypothetical protein
MAGKVSSMSTRQGDEQLAQCSTCFAELVLSSPKAGAALPTAGGESGQHCTTEQQD